MLKKLLSLYLAVLFLVPVSAETFSYSGGSGRVSIVCDGVESREDGAYAAIRFVSNNHSKTDYRYVRIGEDKYYPDENGQFVIPPKCPLPTKSPTPFSCSWRTRTFPVSPL